MDVVTSKGIDWQREKWQSGLGSKFIHQGEKNAVKYADEIIVLSKGVQDYFKETYGRETHFIPNGVNRPQIREASLITDKFGLKKDSYILFLGRLVPEKGIRYLVEAFKNVKTDKKLVIAGSSSDTDSFMEELKELAKGDDRILFTGFVQGAMLDELYSNAYIYTLPSDLEGIAKEKEDSVLAYPNEDYNGVRYKNWCSQYVITDRCDSPYGQDMPYLNEEIIYSLRNCLLHQSTPNVEQSKIHESRCKVDKFELVITGEDGANGDLSMVAYGKDMNIVRRELQVPISHLCYILCTAAEDYYKNNKEKFDFIKYSIEDDRPKTFL